MPDSARPRCPRGHEKRQQQQQPVRRAAASGCVPGGRWSCAVTSALSGPFVVGLSHLRRGVRRDSRVVCDNGLFLPPPWWGRAGVGGTAPRARLVLTTLTTAQTVISRRIGPFGIVT